MTREELIKHAKEYVAQWGDLDMKGLPTWVGRQTDLLRDYLELAAPDWKDAPDSNGFWRIVMPNGCHQVADVTNSVIAGMKVYYLTGSDMDDDIDPSSKYFPRHWSKIDFDDAPEAT